MGKTVLPKKRISRSLLVGTLVLLLLLGAGLGVLGSTTYKKGMMDRYQVLLESLLRLTKSQIDADDLAMCIETGVESAKFQEEQEFLDYMKNTCSIKYVYVVKPLNTEETDNMMNVIAGVSDEERILYADILVKLGELTGTEYSPEVAQMYLTRMDRSDSITYYDNTTEWGYMYTGLTPLHDKNGDPVAILSIDVAMDEIHQTLKRYNTITGVSTGLLALLSFAFTYFWLRRRIIQPIERLNASVESFEHGNFDLELEKFKKDDELRNLALSFTDMTRRIDAYTEEVARATAEQGRISAENNVAKQIQTDILPGVFPAFPERRDFDIFASLYSSKDICGDYFDFFLIDDDHLGMVMGDVSGKGVPAAMFMVIVKTLIKNRALQGFSPAEVLQNVSEQVLEGNEAGMYATVWLAVLELSTGKGIAANAGFEHPVLCRAGKRFELQEYRHSPPVGAMEGVRFRDHGFQMEPGDALFLYSDGVKEAKNQKEENFGTARILEALNREPDATPSVLLQTMKSSIDSFCGEAQQMDDLTMLSLKYYGTGQPSDGWK